MARLKRIVATINRCYFYSKARLKMNVTYLYDESLDFLQHCSEEQLADFAVC